MNGELTKGGHHPLAPTRLGVRDEEPVPPVAETDPEVSLVLPAYNEEDSLALLHEEITQVMQRLGKSYEVVYVNDGSVDSSSSVLFELAASDRCTRVVTFPSNMGKAEALKAGFAAARGRIIVTLDADLQDDPGEIGNLLAKLEDDFDLVIGWKRNRQDPLSKTLPSKMFNILVSLIWGVRLHDVDSGLKAYRREVTDHLTLRGGFYRFIPVMATTAGFRVGEVVVNHRPRRFGDSKYGLTRLLTVPLDLLLVLGLTRFRGRPAQFALILRPITTAPVAVLATSTVYALTGRLPRLKRVAGSMLLGLAIAASTALVLAALGVLVETSTSRREPRRRHG